MWGFLPLPQAQRLALAAEGKLLRERELQLSEGQAALKEQQARLRHLHIPHILLAGSRTHRYVPICTRQVKAAASKKRLESQARAQGIWTAATQVWEGMEACLGSLSLDSLECAILC